ncbi:MAG: hypothetical protein K6G26_09955, partial [Lachnospiraceae bacterium]|nr:hypothetical protein [Lachnospiraceae bacterium]
MSNKVSKSNISKKSLYKLVTFNVVMLFVGSYIGYMMARAKNFLSVSLKLSHIDTVTELINSNKLDYYYEKYNISSSLQFVIRHWDIFNPLLLTSLIMIIIVFVYGNYINLFQKNPVTIFFDKDKELDMDTYYNALDACSVKKVFALPVNITTEHLKRFSNKEVALSSMLNNYFTEGEMTYDKFNSIIDET